MRFFTLMLFSLAFTTTNFAQKLVSYEYINTIEIGAINFISPLIRPQFDIDLYKLTYNTTDARGVEHVASGLVCIPDGGDLIYPLACYQHGTVAGRDDVPSLLKGGFQLPLAFSSHGYVVAAPDYVGLGDSPGIHPYIHAASEASAGVDMLLAVREMAEDAEVALNDQLFIAGYSQGGHAAMALQKEIEENQSDNFTITASAPMSGPYDVSGKMVEFTLGDEPYATVSYLAWLTLGYQEAYPDELGFISLEDVFEAEYIEDIRKFENEEIDLWELNTLLTERLIANGHNVNENPIPKFMLKPEILDALFNDPTHPLSIALADNNLYDWAPQVPTRMYYCQGDDQVTYENAILAEETMKANGAPDVTAVRKDTDLIPLDHGGCVIPASVDGIEWFDTFQELLSSNERVSWSENMKVYYAQQTLTVQVDELQPNTSVLIYDMAGRQQAQFTQAETESRYDLTELTEGFYLIHIYSGQTLQHASKVVKY